MMLTGQHAPYLDHQVRGLSLFRSGVHPSAAPGPQFRDLSFHAPWSSIGIAITGANGAGVRAGFKGYYPNVPFDCTVMAATLEADAAGSIVFDVYRTPRGSIPKPANTLTPLEIGRPKLVSQRIMRDFALFGWSTTLLKGDVLGFDVLSVSGLNTVTLSLLVARNDKP